MIYWPAALPILAMTPPEIDFSARSGGVGITGSEMVVGTPGGRWSMSVTTIIHDAETLEAWAALRAGLEGGAGHILMPVMAGCYQPGEVLRTAFAMDDAVSGFDDGTQFIEDSLVVTLAAAAEINAVDLDLNTATALRAGWLIGFGTRIHRIHTARPLIGGVQRVSIRPWLRAPLAAGRRAQFRCAYCQMRLKDRGQLSQVLDIGRFGRPTLEFVEVF